MTPLQRCAELLRNGDALSHAQAVEIAQDCVTKEPARAEAYVWLTRALLRARRASQAVIWAKKGLVLEPANEELQSSLREARLAVLNELVDNGDDDDDENEDYAAGNRSASWGAGSSITTIPFTPSRSANEPAQPEAERPITTTTLSTSTEKTVANKNSTTDLFDAKVERILHHLDLSKLMRLASVYILAELCKLRCVTVGLSLVVLSLLVHAVLHRQKLMVICIVVVCVYRSKLSIMAQQRLEIWARTSTDKLRAFTWIPRVVTALPIVLKVIGQCKFMLFVTEDFVLAALVSVISCALVANSFRPNVSDQVKMWGCGRHLKFASYLVVILYWAGWQGHVLETLNRLLAPALLDAGAILLGSVTSDDIQGVCRRAWKRLYEEVTNDIQQDVDMDTLFFLGLTNWAIEYWQQPTNLSLEMLTQMLSDGFNTLEKNAVKVFRPELHHLSSQMKDFAHSSELAVLVAYLKKSLDDVPPPRKLALLGLFAKRCTSFVAFAILVTFFGRICIPLVAFLTSEANDAKIVFDLYESGEAESMDGLEILLLGSPLLRVWENVKASLYVLESSVTITKAVATGAKIISTAARLRTLASFASRLSKYGFTANAHEIPDHLTSAFEVAAESSAIAEGIRHLYNSGPVQDVAATIVNWWQRKRTTQSSVDAQHQD